MRITIVVPVLEASGGARIVAGHAERLADRGHEVLFVAPRRAPPNLKERIKQLLRKSPKSTPRKRTHIDAANVSVHVPRHYGKITEQDVPDADCIIATWWETAEWISGFSRSKGVKVHFIQHYEGFAPMPTDRVDAVWRLPFHKITIAQWLVDLGRERFGIESIPLVPNSVDDRFRCKAGRTRQGPPIVGFLYHSAEFKDLPTTIASINTLKKIIPNIKFVAFGSTMPARNELPPEVEFHYLPTQDTIVQIYARCHAWLSTSQTEGFNLPPLEAMASGCPAVCGKTGRPLEVIEDGVNGYLVDVGDVRGFVGAINKILSLPDQSWADMSAAAIRSVAHPDWTESSMLFEKALMDSLNAAHE